MLFIINLGLSIPVGPITHIVIELFSPILVSVGSDVTRIVANFANILLADKGSVID